MNTNLFLFDHKISEIYRSLIVLEFQFPKEPY
jgi:hypothetical protein